MSITSEQAAEMQARVNAHKTPHNERATKAAATVVANGKCAIGAATTQPQTPLQKMQALGRMPGRKMNKTEAAYARLLETQKYMGEILWWAFEPINIRLADNTFYKVDWLVLLADMRIEARETKGYWTDDALVKFKVAANILPFPFKAIRMVKGSFETILEK